MTVWPRCSQQATTLHAPAKRVTFAQPFFLKGLDGMQPSGTYRVVAGAWRERFLSLFIGERRTKSRWGSGNQGAVRVLRLDTIDPLDLAIVLIRDALAAEAARSGEVSDETG